MYALGVLLYLLLAGRHPTGEGRRSAAEHLKGILETEPPRLTTTVTREVAEARSTSMERLRRLCAGDLDNIVAKALKKRPEERYATVGALAEDLQRHQKHEPVRARRDSLRYRAGKFVRRNRAPLALAALTVVALSGGVARERQLRSRAEAEARKAIAVEEYLVNVFAAADPFAPPETRQPEVTARTLLDRGADRMDTAFVNQLDVRAELRAALGRVYTNLAIYDKAEAQLRRSLEERRSAYGTQHAAVAEGMDLLGQVLLRQGRFSEADSLLRAALAQRRKLFGNRHEATATSLDHLAELLRDRNDFATAERLFREALAIRLSLHGENDLRVAASRNNLGRLLWLRDRFRDAAVLYREALAIRERALGAEHPLTGETLHNLAQVEQFQGRHAEAESLYRQAVAIQRTTLGNDHPSLARSLTHLGMLLYRETPRVEEAESLVQEALAVNRGTFGEKHPAVSDNLLHLAVIAQRRGDFDEAERLNRQALAIDRSLYGPEHRQIAGGLSNIAAVLRLRGKPDSAIPLLREAHALYRRLSGEDAYSTTQLELHLARALRESGQLPEAERWFRAGLNKLPPTDRASIVGAQVDLGRTLSGMGRPAEALSLIEPAWAESGQLFQPEHWFMARVQLGLGECLLALGQYARAEPLLLQAHATLNKQRRTQPVLAEDARAALGQLYQAWDKPVEARKYSRTRAS